MSFIIASKKHKAGFLVLTLVLLTSVILLAVATGILLRSISNVIETTDSEKSIKAWAAVNACGEYALLQLSTTSDSLPGWDYLGGETPAFLSEVNSCYIYPVVASGTSKVIMASSTVSGFTRKVLIEVATNTPRMVVSSWKYVADF